MKKTILIIVSILVGLSFSFILAADFKTPHRFKPGDVISADILNEIFDYIETSKRTMSVSDLVGSWQCTKYRTDNFADSHGIYPPGYISSTNKLFISLNGLTLNIAEDSSGNLTWSSPSRNVFEPWLFVVLDSNSNPTSRYSDECAGTGIIESIEGDFAVTSPNCLADLGGYGPPTQTVPVNMARISDSRIKIKMANANLLCDLKNVPPIQPLDLVVNNIGNTVQLSWTDNSSDEVGFKILRKDTLVGNWVEVMSATANTTSYSDTIVSAGTYWYRIKAYNANGNSLGSNVVKVVVE